MKSLHHLPAIIRTAAHCLILYLATHSTSFAQIHSLGYETPTMVDFESTEVTVSESATNVILHLFRTGEFRTISRIDYVTVEGTASEGQDYQGSGGTLVFQPGEGYKTITIPIIADDIAEDPETFRVELHSSDSRIILVRNSATVTIHEDSSQAASLPSLQIESADNASVVVSWPQSSRQFILEKATSCPQQTWEQVPAEPQLNGSRYEVRQQADGPLLVFRLHAQ